VATWDFVDQDENVYHYHSHGTQVLSCIAGSIDGLDLGLATGAEFLLARTENNAEKFSEEENWLAAAEWADRNGADIINSSLGYTHHRYFNDQMDGNTSLVAKAAKIAAKKGILVVNSAGNEGNSAWHYVGTPADADSVLSIGGISPERGYHINFSSFGPTADKRMKPNLCAFGKVIAAKKDSVYYTQGTSFSSPLVAGFAACAWQKNREWDNMTLFGELERSGELYPYFDYAHGFGVPQASYFFKKNNANQSPSFSFVELDGYLHVMVEPDMVSSINQSKNLLFYNFQDKTGVLSSYAVVDVYKEKALSIDLKKVSPGTTINVWFRDYNNSYYIN
jgi:subtilisin family serine protease